MGGSFDVFCSYASRDHAAVEGVARALTDRGLRVFLDRWYLTPGQPWPQALEQTLADCNAVAVFIGSEGLGSWQQRERDLALDRQARELAFPVIPVLLSRADPALGFLKLNTWVDLSESVVGDDALTILAAAIRREPPGDLARQRIEAIRASVCPYRGLQPFREEDEPFFFGRTPFAGTLTAAALHQPFVAVVGSSGSGKSSVVRAGLIPRLRRGAGGLVWDAVTLVPTDRPLISLAAALLPLLEPNLSEVDRLAEVGKLASYFGDGAVALRDVAVRVLAKQPGTDRLLLFVDQWEEVYTLCGDASVRQAFINQLLDAAATNAVRVVMTIRGDFMGQALDNRQLSDRLQDRLVTIGPMTRGELEETIVQPAAKTGLSFDAGLPETILDDLGEEPGGLPLLEFLLEGLWRERRGTVLTHDAYARLGRVGGAIAYRAEEVFERSLNEAERQAAQRLLMRMVRPGEGVEDTRRRAALAEADAVAEATIQKLAKERLVVTERDAGTGDVTVEVAHEALIRRWQRFRDWIDADREFLRTRERIATQAQLWNEEKRLAERLLPPGRPLAEGEDLLAKRRGDLEPLAIDYIEASAALHRKGEEARRFAQQVRIRNAITTAFTMAFLALLSLVFGGIAWWQRDEANRNAEEAQRNAAIAEAREFAARADSSADIGAALALAVEAELRTSVPLSEARGAFARAAKRAWNTFAVPDGTFQTGRETIKSIVWSPDGTKLAYAKQHAVHIINALSGEPLRELASHSGWAHAVWWSPDGNRLALGENDGPVENDGTVWMWDARTYLPIGGPLRINGFMIAWSPDGTRLASSHLDETLVWDARTGKQIRVLPHGRSGRKSYLDLAGEGLSWSPDGTRLATGVVYDNSIRVWDVGTGQQIGLLQGHTDRVLGVAWSPDGIRLASSSADGTIRLWDATSGKQLRALQGHTDRVSGVAWSPDGTRLASSGGNDGVRLWDGRTGELLGPNLSHSGDTMVGAVVWSPDGKRLAVPVVSGRDRNYWSTEEISVIRLWKVTGRAPADNALQGHTSEVLTVAWSPDGSRLASGSSDGTVRLWDADTGKSLPDLLQRLEGVWHLAWSPDRDSHRIASVSDSGIRVWTVMPGAMAGKPWWRSGGVNVVAWSPDGVRLASGMGNGAVHVWDAASGKRAGAPLRQASSEETSPLVTSIAWAPNKTVLATGNNDGSVQLLNGNAGKLVCENLQAHKDAVLSLAWSHDATRLASASRDGAVRLWDIAGCNPVGAPLLGHDGAVQSVAWSPDGSRLASGGSDGAVQLWDPLRGTPIGEIPDAHPSGVISLTWSPDGTRIATAGSDNKIRVWSALTERDACREAKQELGDALASVLGDGRHLTACASPESVKTLPPLPVLPAVFPHQ